MGKSKYQWVEGSSGGTMKRWGFVFLTLVSVFVLMVYSCKGRQRKQTGGVVMVSIEPLRYFTERIAGNRFQVQTIVPKGFSPENYEPSPQQLVTVSEASAYIKVGGLGFESTWLDKIVQNEPNLPVFSASDSLDCGPNGLRLSNFDLHTWTTPQNAEVICRNICAALCRIDSAGSDVYQQNLSKLLNSIREVDGKVHDMLANIPSRVFVTAHPSLSYFASQYGLVQLSIEKDGKEPSPQELTDLIRKCKQENVRVILVQPEFHLDNAYVLSRETGARIVRIDPLNYQWDKEVLRVAAALKNEKK